jgi:SPP1 gp7 family putative phage head morphogenesis protein
MIAGIRKSLLEGVERMMTSEEIAQLIESRVNGIGLNRARAIARTEIVRAHAEATLDRLEAHGVGFVSALVEYTIADDQACPICKALAATDNGYGAGLYTIEQARGIIPVHPNCRCAWLPALKALAVQRRANAPSDAGQVVPLVLAALRRESRVLDWLLGGRR